MGTKNLVWWKWLLLFVAGFLLFLLAYGLMAVPVVKC